MGNFLSECTYHAYPKEKGQLYKYFVVVIQNVLMMTINQHFLDPSVLKELISTTTTFTTDVVIKEQLVVQVF
jgi:rRNA-processing protein FCF1